MPDIFVGNNTEEDAQVNNDGDIKPVSDEPPKPTPLKHKHSHSHTHLFSAYCDYPQAVKVADKQDDEEILLYLRKHFVTNIPWIIRTLGMILVIPFFFYVISFGLIDLAFLPYEYIIMIIIFYYMIVFTYAFVKYLSWFYNISLVTDKRIIDIDFSSLVYENVEATKLTQVEDVGYSQIGIIRSIFDYGDVNLHTAGPTSNFEFLAVPHPERVIKTINNLIGKTKND